MTDANNGIAFSMTKEEENNKKSKKKEITCYKFKKTGHYVNECDEEGTVKTSNKKGSNFLLLKNDKYESSSDEESDDYAEGNNHSKLHIIAESNNEEKQSKESSDNEESTNDDDATISDDEEYSGFAFLQEDIVCSNHDKVPIPKSWILLDSQSTVDVFSNPKLLTKIREFKRILT